MSAFDDAVAGVGKLDEGAGRAAAELHQRLTKPAGALGLLEITGARLAAIAREAPPPVPTPAVVAVFAGDHGVVAEGVTPWPQEVTAQMVANFVAGGAAINVLARQTGARVMVIDVGVAAELASQPGLLGRKVRAGTGNIAVEPAMTRAEARRALDVGAEVATAAIGSGMRCLVTGDMGIGNTTPSAALVAALTGRRAAEVTGRGTGVDDAMLGHKIEVVARAIGRAAPAVDSGDAIAVLTELGGLEIAALSTASSPSRPRASPRASRRLPWASASPATGRRSPPRASRSTTSVWSRSSTSACAWARGRAPAWRYRCSRPPPASCARWPPSTPRGSRRRRDLARATTYSQPHPSARPPITSVSQCTPR